MKDTLGDRMKSYEAVTRFFVTPRSYAIIRIDGCHFHTFTRGCEKPFDERLRLAMINTMAHLVKDIQGVKFGYHQSDEISLLLTDFDSISTTAWYSGNVQKIASVSASQATANFNLFYADALGVERHHTLATFDARVFVLPNATEVMNYFLWRIQDAERNSISGLAQSLYSQKQLNGVKKDQLKALSKDKGHDWDQLDYWNKRGTIYTRESGVFSEPPTSDNKWDLLKLIPNPADQPQASEADTN
jgi:tRNA(His) 5'-end guanylyltransferase